jgi:hypothetical protein
MIRIVTNFYRHEVLTPFQLCTAMDKHGSSLSYQGIEVLRELLNKGTKYTRDCLLPSKSTIIQVATIVEKCGRWAFLYLVDSLPIHLGGCEHVAFDKKAAIELLLKSGGIKGDAKVRHITLPSSCDTVVYVYERPLHACWSKNQ